MRTNSESELKTDTMLQDLRQYLKETPQELILKEWDSLSRFDNVGPTVNELIESWKNCYNEDFHEYLKYPEPERLEINKSETPNFEESFFFLKLHHESRKSGI